MPRRLLASETPRPERAIGQKHALNLHLATNLNPLAGVVNQPTLPFTKGTTEVTWTVYKIEEESKPPDFGSPRVLCHQGAALLFA